MENVDRQDEREGELKQELDELEERGDQMEQRTGELDDQVEKVREEFQRRKDSPEVPGAQDEPEG